MSSSMARAAVQMATHTNTMRMKLFSFGNGKKQRSITSARTHKWLAGIVTVTFVLKILAHLENMSISLSTV